MNFDPKDTREAVDQVDRGVAFQFKAFLGLRQRLELQDRVFACHLRLEEDRETRVGRGALDLHLVIVLADLQEGHEPREVVLLGRLPLDVQALPHSDAAQHFRDGVAACGPVHGEPLALVPQLNRRLLVARTLQVAYTSRTALVAEAIEVGDRFPRVKEVLLLLQLLQGPQHAFEAAALQAEQLRDVGGDRDGRCPACPVDERKLAETVAGLVKPVRLAVVAAGEDLGLQLA
mmetsp:Transcript_113181/g.326994  ORF Transcript_113181/g.326994 Transcript_113181/m.326994 type:complete len:232 (+) Transcript_113181:1090-1785(+)